MTNNANMQILTWNTFPFGNVNRSICVTPQSQHELVCHLNHHILRWGFPVRAALLLGRRQDQADHSPTPPGCPRCPSRWGPAAGWGASGRWCRSGTDRGTSRWAGSPRGGWRCRPSIWAGGRRWPGPPGAWACRAACPGGPGPRPPRPWARWGRRPPGGGPRRPGTPIVRCRAASPGCAASREVRGGQRNVGVSGCWTDTPTNNDVQQGCTLAAGV